MGTANPLYSVSELTSLCIGVSCQLDAQAIELMISNQDPISIVKAKDLSIVNEDGCTADRCIDVSGYCSLGGYQDSSIFVEVTGSNPVSRYSTGSGCGQNGRFRAVVRLPEGFPENDLHSIVVTLVVFDGHGEMIENPSGLNRKQIGLLIGPAPSDETSSTSSTSEN